AISLGAAVKWVRRRLSVVHELLATVLGLMPERFGGCVPTVASFRRRLGTSRVLVTLRALCTRYLHGLVAPLGLLGPPNELNVPPTPPPQSVGPDPPASWA